MPLYIIGILGYFSLDLFSLSHLSIHLTSTHGKFIISKAHQNLDLDLVPFQFNFSQIKNLKSRQFVSSPVFHALGKEWVIECYSRYTDKYTSFTVRNEDKISTLNAIIFSCSLMKKDGTPFPLQPKASYIRGQVGIAHGNIPQRQLEDEFVNDGSFELICTTDETNVCTKVVLKSFNLQSQFGKLLESNETADITFDVENRSFTGHKIILAARSPVLKAELFGNMLEATQKRIKIKDMSAEVFEAMLHFIYTDSIRCSKSDKTSTIMAQHLFVAADRYSIEGLKALCEDQLQASISLDTIEATLALSEQHDSLRLKNACIEFIATAEPGALVNWMLTDKYVDLVRSFPSVMAEIRAKVNNCPYSMGH